MSEDDEPSFDPSEALRVMGAQQRAARRQLFFPSHLNYLLWGVIYLLGYLPMAVSRGPQPLVAIPLGVVLTWFSMLMVAGLVVSIAFSVRTGQGLRGASNRQGRRYGYLWALSFISLIGVWYRVSIAVAGDDAIGLVTNGVSMVVVGILFMAGGVIWMDTQQFRIGAGVCLVTSFALIVGLPAYYWLMALVIGGGLVLVGLAILARRARRAGRLR